MSQNSMASFIDDPSTTLYGSYRSKWDCAKGLVTNYGEGGGATKREGGGHVKFYPFNKRGWKKF